LLEMSSTLAHVTTEARQLLYRFEDTVAHDEVVLAPFKSFEVKK